MSPTTPHDRILFPPFELDLTAGRLLKGAATVDLSPKAYSVLRYLAERPGQLVSKEELIQTVWQGVHVGDDVLKVAVAAIRKTLGDPYKEPLYIETAHRRGYRFIAKVETAAELPVPAAGLDALDFEIPKTHYARSRDVNIAFQVLGDGPIDLVFVMGWVSHLEYFWSEPSFARFLRRLAKFSRLILFDKRGTGLSDRVSLDALPTLEQRMDDVRAVMDKVGSKRAAICGVSEGGAMSALFAATYPERTAALAMIGSYSKRIRDESYPWGPTAAERDEFLEEIREHWGGPVGLEHRAPSMAEDPHFRNWWAAYLRTAASPAAAVALTRMNSLADIRSILPAIRVPSLVIHRTGDQCLNVEEGRYVASRIPGARFVELPGDDHLPFVGDQDAILDEMEEFLTGVRHTLEPDTVLATVLFTQIASNDDRLKQSNREELLRRLRAHITKEIEWFRGREIDMVGDRPLAIFDGPARAVRCALAIIEYASRLGVETRAGLHTGECEIVDGKVAGQAAELGVCVANEARYGEVLVSSTVKDLVAGSGIRFEDRGVHMMSECGEWRLFSVQRGAKGDS